MSALKPTDGMEANRTIRKFRIVALEALLHMESLVASNKNKGKSK